MSSRCSICQHPQHDAIDVSVLRDGTRFTARRFQVSRPSLDRHKKHLAQSVAVADQARGVAASSDGATSLLSQLDVMIRQCESALSQAQADKNFPGAMRAIKELRAHFELKYKLESKERKHQGSKDPPEQNSRATESLQETPEDVYKSLAITTLRLRIRLAARELGEIAVITERNNLEYLQHKYVALVARIEQRQLLRKSEGLAKVATGNNR